MWVRLAATYAAQLRSASPIGLIPRVKFPPDIVPLSDGFRFGRLFRSRC